MHKNQLYFYTRTINNLKRKLRKQFHLYYLKNKTLNLSNKVKDLYTKNYKILLKEFKDINKWKEILC